MSVHSHLTINLPDGRSYPIFVGDGITQNLASLFTRASVSAKHYIIISDESVASHWLPAIRSQCEALAKTDTITLPVGEKTKSFSQLQNLVENILSLRPDRKTMLIALGGGVIGDLTGFAASITLRGIPFIQIPTTLLSQVDSSVGGKTGINTTHGKNLVGSFYQPQLVAIDTRLLTTLPKRELHAGIAEIVKAAIICDSSFFAWLEKSTADIANAIPSALAEAITTSVNIKARIVEEDEKESGKRALLNLGHSFGHALEILCAYDGSLNHGEAVAIGMVMAAKVANSMKLLDHKSVLRIESLLHALELPTSPSILNRSLSSAEIVAAMQNDKKNENNQLTLILPHAIGHCEIHKNQLSCDIESRLFELYGR